MTEVIKTPLTSSTSSSNNSVTANATITNGHTNPTILHVSVGGRVVEVSWESSLNPDQAKKCLEAVPFTEWTKAISLDPQFIVHSVRFQSVDFFGPRVGFMKFRADVRTAEGSVLPGLVFMRGGAVGILVILRCAQQLFTIITLQPRVPTGLFQFPEIPAGMLDHSGDFAGIAAKEMKEECGLSISDTDPCLVDLTEFAYGDRFRGVYPSAGGCDEFLRLFVYHKDVSQEKLDKLKGKLTGNRDHGELITLKIVPLADLWKEAPDSKALSALYLFEKFKQQNPHWPPPSRQ
jgi:ADP-sugar diphosphatase